MALTSIKVDSVSPDIRILRMFLIAFIALKLRSHAAIDGDMVNVSRTNNIMSANPSGVSAIRLVYVSNGHHLCFLESNIFSSGHCPMSFASLPRISEGNDISNTVASKLVFICVGMITVIKHLELGEGCLLQKLESRLNEGNDLINKVTQVGPLHFTR